MNLGNPRIFACSRNFQDMDKEHFIPFIPYSAFFTFNFAIISFHFLSAVIVVGFRIMQCSTIFMRWLVLLSNNGASRVKLSAMIKSFPFMVASAHLVIQACRDGDIPFSLQNCLLQLAQNRCCCDCDCGCDCGLGSSLLIPGTGIWASASGSGNTNTNANNIVDIAAIAIGIFIPTPCLLTLVLFLRGTYV